MKNQIDSCQHVHGINTIFQNQNDAVKIGRMHHTISFGLNEKKNTQQQQQQQNKSFISLSEKLTT